MKKLFPILFIALFLNSLNIFSQNFAPIGAEWYYELESPFDFSKNFSKWESVSDTIILGKTANKIIRTDGYVGTSDTVMYVYEDSGLVYKYLPITNSFTILYNFNANANDSWLMDVDTNCSLTVNVDSTSTTLINGFNLKVLYVSTINSEFSGTIIERLGHQTGSLPNINFLCYSIADGGSYYNGLRCYSDSTFGNYNSGIASSCNYVTVGINDNSWNNINISIHPNPTNTILNIDFKNSNNNIDSKFQIFDLTGKMLMQLFNKKVPAGRHSMIWPSPDIPEGMYLIKMTTKFKVSTRKILKVK